MYLRKVRLLRNEQAQIATDDKQVLLAVIEFCGPAMLVLSGHFLGLPF